MKKFFKLIIFLPIIFVFLPTFAFVIPSLGAAYLWYFITIYIALIYIFITDGKFLIKKIQSVIKTTPFKYFCLVLVLMVITSILNVCIGNLNFLLFVRSFFMQIILGIIPLIIYFIYIIDRKISLENFIKLFLILYWSVMILGFISWMADYLNITFINDIFDIIVNKRFLSQEFRGFLGTTEYSAFGIPRLQSVWEEPSYCARYYTLFLPFIYTFANAKLKLFSNIIVNKIITKTLVPFTWLSLILTESPIFIVIVGIVSSIYYYKAILKIVKKYLAIIALIIFIIILFGCSIDLSQTYLSRIINVLGGVRSLEDFVLIEPSLATRVISYITKFKIFIQHPLIGVGLGNVNNFLYNNYLHSSIPLTPEIISKTNIMIYYQGKAFANSGYLYDMLAMFGIFTFSIFALFFYKVLKFIKIIQLNTDLNDWNYYIAKALFGVTLCLCAIICYDTQFLQFDIYFIIALDIAFLYHYVTILVSEQQTKEGLSEK